MLTFENFLPLFARKVTTFKKMTKVLRIPVAKNRSVFFYFTRHRSEREISNRKFLLLNFAQLFENPSHIDEKIFKKNYFFENEKSFWNRRRIMFTKTGIRF